MNFRPCREAPNKPVPMLSTVFLRAGIEAIVTATESTTCVAMDVLTVAVVKSGAWSLLRKVMRTIIAATTLERSAAVLTALMKLTYMRRRVNVKMATARFSSFICSG